MAAPGLRGDPGGVLPGDLALHLTPNTDFIASAASTYPAFQSIASLFDLVSQ